MRRAGRLLGARRFWGREAGLAPAAKSIQDDRWFAVHVLVGSKYVVQADLEHLGQLDGDMSHPDQPAMRVELPQLRRQVTGE